MSKGRLPSFMDLFASNNQLKKRITNCLLTLIAMIEISDLKGGKVPVSVPFPGCLETLLPV